MCFQWPVDLSSVIRSLGARKINQELRALASVPQDLLYSQLLHQAAYTAHGSSCREPDALCDLLEYQHICDMYIRTHKYIKPLRK